MRTTSARLRAASARKRSVASASDGGLRERLEGDLRAATKARDAIRRETLRLCLAAIHNEEIARRGALDVATTLTVLGRQAKMRRESIEAFARGRREDLVTKERAELAVIEGYLPSQLEPSEIRAAAVRAIAESGAAGPRDQGKVMQRVMGELRGRADGKVVAAIVGDLLGAERESGRAS